MTYLEQTVSKVTSSSVWEAAGIPRGGIQLLDQIETGFEHRSFKQVADYSGLSQETLIKSLGFNRTTFNRRAKTGRLNSDESDRLYRFSEVLSNTIDLFEGDKHAAITWLQQPIQGLGNRTPICLVKSLSGSEMVLRLIGRLEHGAYS